MAPLEVMEHRPNQHRNLIHGTISSLAQYGLQFLDVDQPIITNKLQLLLHELSERKLFGKPNSNVYTNSNSPFTIVGNRNGHTPYSYNHELRQWLLMVVSHYPLDDRDDHTLPPPSLLY